MLILSNLMAENKVFIAHSIVLIEQPHSIPNVNKASSKRPSPGFNNLSVKTDETIFFKILKPSRFQICNKNSTFHNFAKVSCRLWRAINLWRWYHPPRLHDHLHYQKTKCYLQSMNLFWRAIQSSQIYMPSFQLIFYILMGRLKITLLKKSGMLFLL